MFQIEINWGICLIIYLVTATNALTSKKNWRLKKLKSLELENILKFQKSWIFIFKKRENIINLLCTHSLRLGTEYVPDVSSEDTLWDTIGLHRNFSRNQLT